jgi:hypothetical protein
VLTLSHPELAEEIRSDRHLLRKEQTAQALSPPSEARTIRGLRRRRGWLQSCRPPAAGRQSGMFWTLRGVDVMIALC